MAPHMEGPTSGICASRSELIVEQKESLARELIDAIRKRFQTKYQSCPVTLFIANTYGEVQGIGVLWKDFWFKREMFLISKIVHSIVVLY